MEYEYSVQSNEDNIDNFLNDLKAGWMKLVLSLIGEQFDNSEYVKILKLFN